MNLHALQLNCFREPIFPPTIFSIPSNACGSQELIRRLKQKSYSVGTYYHETIQDTSNFFVYSQLTYTQHMLQINVPPVVYNTTKSPCSFQGPNLRGFGDFFASLQTDVTVETVVLMFI